MDRNGRDFLQKKKSGCQLKAYIDENAERRRLGMQRKAREDCEPIDCEYASEGSRPDDPVCEVVRRPITNLEVCPERQSAVSSDSQAPDTSQPPLLEGLTWIKTKSV